MTGHGQMNLNPFVYYFDQWFV